MEFLEKDLEQIIWETDNELLKNRAFGICGKKYKQLKIGNYGVADIVTLKKLYSPNKDPYIEVTIYELKREKISMSSFIQAVRYTRGIQLYLENRGLFEDRVVFNIVLCAKTIDTSSDFVYLSDLICNGTDFIIPNMINNVTLYTFKYTFNGIYFEQHSGYKIINNEF